ncbi:hypothetical protein JMR96_003079 [Salmonella enterica]|nr:hypothetical protein [Salmonella enterica]EKC9053325.1 hypothetical protein [Salmonella enterica]
MKHLTIALVLAGAGLASTSAFAEIAEGGLGASDHQQVTLDGGWNVRGQTNITAGSFKPNDSLKPGDIAAQKVGTWDLANTATGSYKIASVYVTGPGGDETSSFTVGIANHGGATLPTRDKSTLVQDTTPNNLEVQLWKNANTSMNNGYHNATVIVDTYTD